MNSANVVHDDGGLMTAAKLADLLHALTRVTAPSSPEPGVYVWTFTPGENITTSARLARLNENGGSL